MEQTLLSVFPDPKSYSELIKNVTTKICLIRFFQHVADLE